MSDNVRMSNAPVYYVLAQIKFTPVKAMKKYVDVTCSPLINTPRC